MKTEYSDIIVMSPHGLGESIVMLSGLHLLNSLKEVTKAISSHGHKYLEKTKGST